MKYTDQFAGSSGDLCGYISWGFHTAVGHANRVKIPALRWFRKTHLRLLPVTFLNAACFSCISCGLRDGSNRKMLNDYMTEFRSLHAELLRLFESAHANSGSRKAIESKMREMKDCLGALEMELRSMSPAQRNGYLAQIQMCREEFAALQRRYLLLTSDGRDVSAATQKLRCGQSLEKLNSANMQLESTRKLAEETEEVGANILCNLYMQRETIQRANRHAEETNTSLRESSSLISKMGKWWNGLIG